MSAPRYAKTRDAIEPVIVEALERVGALVFRMHTPADLLVYFRRTWHVLEVKRKERNDQPQQQEFRRLTGTPIVATVDDALFAVGARRAA